MRSLHLQEASVRYFLEVVKRGSISVAASRLFVSSSAVSRQIAALENVLGVPLFERRPRGMTPTAAGELLAMYAQRMMLEAEQVVSDIQGLQGLLRGMVRIATSSGFALEFLPSVITLFQQRYPGVQFQVKVTRAAAVTTAILSGDADIGLTYSRAAERDIHVEHQQTAPVLVIMRPDHPLAGHESLRLAQLQPYRLALPDRDNTVRQLFDVCCSRHQLVFEPAFVTDSFDALVSYVMHGDALSIAGEVTVRNRMQRGELTGMLLQEHGMADRSIEVQTLMGRTLPEGARVFLDTLTEQLRASAGTGTNQETATSGRAERP